MELQPLKPDVQAEVDKEFNNLWKAIVLNEDGTVNLEAVKRELYDYSCLMDNANKVYIHVTNGAIGKTNTLASAIIAVADDCSSEQLREETKELEEALELAHKEIKKLKKSNGN